MSKIIQLLIVFLGVSYFVRSQEVNSLEQAYRDHVQFLSNDSLEGRMTGSKGEEIASTYIINQFKEIGLTPAGDDSGFLQRFEFNAGKTYEDGNYLYVDQQPMELYKDFYVMAYSSNATLDAEAVDVGFGLTIPDGHSDYKKVKKLKGKIFIIDIGVPFEIDPHSEHYHLTNLRSRIENAANHGASGVIFVDMNGDDKADPNSGMKLKTKSMGIPVLFLKSHVYTDYQKQKSVPVRIKTNLSDVIKEGNNVVAFLDNGASATVVIGAHYDHLGWGEEAGSLYRGKEKMIHNGADDNASGVAMTIELAKTLKNSDLTGNNYLFLAFSGEELGLYGSKSYVETPTVNLNDINYMINMDMVGRLDYADRNLSISGTGTSPVFPEVLEGIAVDSLNFKLKESGTGPSDHTSFYLKDIPVLHFFTGTHEDYHKPSDDAEKVNYPGMVSVTNVIVELIHEINDDGKIEFTKTKSDEDANVPRFTVTLGVIPDYMFDGKGMKIDAVTDGKTASTAGILSGDVVVKMGDLEIVDMMSYMQGLSMYRKGDKTLVSVDRKGEILEFEVEFK